jgi:hypothetical protein
VNRCEQELCRNWAGDAGCSCAVLGVEPDIAEESATRTRCEVGISMGRFLRGMYACALPKGHDGEHWTPRKCSR